MTRSWRTATIPLVAILIGALTACGDSGPSSFVGRASNSVIFVEWTRDDSRVVGTFRQALIKPDDPTTVDENAAPLSGTINGSDVTLRIGGELLGRTMTGELEGSTLKLRMDGAEGGILDVRLDEGASEDYNAGLSALRADADQVASDQAAAQEEADRAAEVASRADRVRSDLEALRTAASGLKTGSETTFDTDLDTIRNSVDTVKRTLDLVKQDIADGETEVVCSDADVVRSDAEVVDGDVEVVLGGDRDVVSDDAAAVRTAIRALRASFGALQADDPALVPAGAPTEAAVNDAIRRARRAIRSAGAGGSSAQREAKKLQARAHAYVAEAKELCRRFG